MELVKDWKMTPTGSIVVVKDSKNTSRGTTGGGLIGSASSLYRIHVDILDEATAIRIGLDVEASPDPISKARQVVTIDVLNASCLLTTTGHHAPIALELAIHDHKVLAWRVQSAPIGIPTRLDRNSIILATEGTVVDHHVVTGLGIAAIAVAFGRRGDSYTIDCDISVERRVELPEPRMFHSDTLDEHVGTTIWFHKGCAQAVARRAKHAL